MHNMFTLKYQLKSLMNYTFLVAFSGEVAKLQNHLSLLREEYVKLQNRLAEVEKKYQIAVAASGQGGDDNFVARLLKTVSDLFDKELYRCIPLVLLGFFLNTKGFVENLMVYFHEKGDGGKSIKGIGRSTH